MRTLLVLAAAVVLAPAAGAQGPPPPPPGLPPMPPGMPDGIPCPPGVESTDEMPCVVLPSFPMPGGEDMGPGPELAPGFLNRVWRLDAEADAYDAEARVLAVTVTRLLNVPRRFRDDDDAIVDEDTSVLLSPTTRVYDRDGDRVRGADLQAEVLDAADTVRVHGKVLPPDRWRTDEDDQPVPTIRAKRVYVTG
jgi:hypothetical protein